jgi:hypothetical protein
MEIMAYVWRVGSVLLFQLVATLTFISAFNGGGSFVALGIMLLAVLGIPLCAILAAAKVSSSLKTDTRNPGSLILLAISLPGLQLALAFAVELFNL